MLLIGVTPAMLAWWINNRDFPGKRYGAAADARRRAALEQRAQRWRTASPSPTRWQSQKFAGARVHRQGPLSLHADYLALFRYLAVRGLRGVRCRFDQIMSAPTAGPQLGAQCVRPATDKLEAS